MSVHSSYIIILHIYILVATEHVPLTKTRSDNIDVFRTQKTPEPLFIPSLILPKGVRPHPLLYVHIMLLFL